MGDWETEQLPGKSRTLGLHESYTVGSLRLPESDALGAICSPPLLIQPPCQQNVSQSQPASCSVESGAHRNYTTVIFVCICMIK